MDFKIRPAVSIDLSGLVRLETVAFDSDRFSEETIEYMLNQARATILVAESQCRIVGAATVLWRKNSRSGRLYNFAVDPMWQKKGIGDSLLQACEMDAARRECDQLTMEVRPDNESALLFYEKRGFKQFKTSLNFYDDGSPAIRMKKRLTVTVPDHARFDVPYYAQTLGFTCGPACLLMVIKHFHPEGKINRIMEMNIWKEATLIFMTSGIGGTDPFGIALAAVRRDFQARVLSSTEKTPFVRSVRIPHKRTVIRLVHEDMKKEALQRGVAAVAYDYTFIDIRNFMLQGWIPISLISNYRLTGGREPHWVVITGFDDQYVYINDPWESSVKEKKRKVRNLKVTKEEFHRMSRYGKDIYRCVIFIGPLQ